jgi:TonB-linked SusC/RagA family outer membrane protein
MKKWLRKITMSQLLILLSVMLVNAQETTLSGKVSSKDGNPIPGVTIVVKGTSTGTITDLEGHFTIKSPFDSKTLVFSFIGMKSKEVPITTSASYNVIMDEDTYSLDEVVAIGYGTVKKSDLTGSVSSIKNEEIKAFSAANVLQALSGRSAGLQVKQNNGAPGGGVSVRIRGTNSIQGSNEPLYVIDGFPSSSSNPTVLSNSDIESIEILKDASAIAIYGSRGANGVVMITTNKGKAGKTKVDYESSFGTQQLREKLEMMNAEEYATLYNEQRTNDGQGAYFTQDQINSFGKGYNWQDLVFRTAPIQNHSLTISGGNEKTQFSISGGLFDQQGIIKGSDYKRYSIRTNINHDISKKFSVSYSATLTRNTSSQKKSEGARFGASLISSALLAPPTLTPYNEDGSYRILHTSYPFLSEGMTNPLNFINEMHDNVKSNKVLANAFLLFKPVEALTLKVYGGIENSDDRSDYYRTLNYINSQGVASVTANQFTSLLNENTISYAKTFNQKHNLSAVAGFTYQDFIATSLSGGGTGFLSDVTETSNLGSANIPGIPGSGYSKSVLLSYLSRINYSFNNKYLFTVSFRADGSSKYSEGNKWGYFPSGAFAWKLKEEDFLKEVSFLTDLKFRASWGVTGSQAINPYATLNSLFSGKTVFGDALYTTFSPSTTLPGNLKWETTEQTNIGMDIAVLENRIRLTADYYIKNTSDLLNTVQLPSSSGFSNTIQNVGQIRNQGLEFSINAHILTGKFNWSVDANIALNKSKVIKLYDGQEILGGYIDMLVFADNMNLLREGEEVGVFYGYMEDGYDEKGNIKYKDASADGMINLNDKRIIGNPNPDFIYGFNSNMSFNNFELSLFFQGTHGNDIVNISSVDNALVYGYGDNLLKEVLYNHWTPTNTNAKYPKITRSQSMNFSDRLVEDGSYLRLRNVELAYNFPFQRWQMNWIRNAQVYASGQNLLTITKYSGWDPEVNSQGGPNSIAQGIDHYSYPTARSITFGVRIGF